MPEWKRQAGSVDPYDAAESGTTLDERANRALAALRAYANADVGVGASEVAEVEPYHVRDLLCDLRHYCDREGIDTEREFRMGEEHYTVEIDEPYEAP